jgi:excisionase family DNA binding protein
MPRTKTSKAPAPKVKAGTAVSVVPRLLTIKQAAAYCACAVWAIRQAIWAKELAALKIGRRFLVPRDTLDSFIDARLRERA